MSKIVIPTHARIKKGTSWDKDGYGQVWCPIKEIQLSTDNMSLIHPKYGAFAWVSIKDCTFKTVINKGKVYNLNYHLCENCGTSLKAEGEDECRDCLKYGKEYNK